MRTRATSRGVSRAGHKGKVCMADVNREPNTCRAAVDRGGMRLQPRALSLIVRRNIPKVAAARLADIMAAKRVGGLIPLCHHYSVLSFVRPSLPAGGGVSADK